MHPIGDPDHDDMRKTDRFAGLFRNNGVLAPDPRRSRPPDLDPFRDDVAVKIGIEVGAPIVPPPAFGVELADCFGVTLKCLPVEHLFEL